MLEIGLVQQPLMLYSNVIDSKKATLNIAMRESHVCNLGLRYINFQEFQNF